MFADIARAFRAQDTRSVCRTLSGQRLPRLPALLLSLLLPLTGAAVLSGCAVVAVADAAATVTATAVSAAATVVGTTVDVAASGVRAVVGNGDKK